MEASQWNNLVAGTLAGIATSMILHPIDLVKVRFQVQDGVAVRVRYTSISAAVGSIWREEGLRGFYRGVVPACVGSGLSWGLYFHFYESCKARLLRNQREAASAGSTSSSSSKDGLSTTQHMYAAWEAGTITCFLTNPVWLIKTRMQLQTGEAAANSGAAAATGNVAARREYRGLVGECPAGLFFLLLLFPRASFAARPLCVPLFKLFSTPFCADAHHPALQTLLGASSVKKASLACTAASSRRCSSPATA